jgi:hypothetical protein
METLMQTTGINEGEINVLVAIINNNPGKSVAYLLLIANRVLKNISLSHAAALGYLIGYTDGTENTAETYTNQIQLCQRLN